MLFFFQCDLETCLMDIIHIWNTIDLERPHFPLKTFYIILWSSRFLTKEKQWSPLVNNPFFSTSMLNPQCYLFDTFLGMVFNSTMKHDSYTRNVRMRNLLY